MPGAAQYMPSEDTLENDSGVDLKICQCSGCGLVQLSNDPVPYYKEVIRATSFSKEITDFRRKQFKTFIKDYNLENKKILEIGCGTGHYLSIMDELDVDASGIEFSAASVELCKNNGLSVEESYIEKRSQKLDHGPFDAFFIMSFLEHVPHPKKILGGIYNNLNDGAVGLVEVPNFDMILKKNLFAEFISDHLFYFTKDTLKLVLQLNGFDIVDCEEVWYNYILSAVVKKRVSFDLSHFREHKEKIRKEIRNYIDGFPEKSVTLWGAGHQALAIMSMAELGGKVKYVVDSATFKQGRFTPVTHLPIVGPDRLDSDPPIAVIVMTASYSDEVVNIIRKDYSPDIKISILRDFGLEKIS